MEVSGLQDYEESDTILNQLNQNLLGKPLAAMVENRGSLSKKIESSNDEIPKLIFFDTSTEDVDININQKLIEFIGRYQLVALSMILRLFILQLKKILTQSCPSQEGKKSR